MSTLDVLQGAARPLARAGGRTATRRNAVLALATACMVAASVAGMVVALRAYGAGQYRLGPADVRVQTAFAARGTADVYIPIVDWGVRAHPFRAPLRLSAQLVSVDRRAALGAIRTGDRDGFRGVEEDAPAVIRQTLVRAALVALAGGLAGGTLGGLALCAVSRRRRHVGFGVLVGLTLAGSTVAGCALLLRSPDYGAFRQPTFYAHGGELPRLLALSDSLTRATAGYESSYRDALTGLDTLVSAAASRRAPLSGRSFLVGSDIHANWLTLPAFARYAAGRPVFLVGDYGQRGTAIEAAIAERAAHVGHPTVAVSGNHDTPLVMRRLARAGAIVLTRSGRLGRDGRVRGPAVVHVAGLLVAAYDDPLARAAGGFGDDLDLSDAQLAAFSGAVAAWFDGLAPRPQAVLVHDFRVAAALREHAAAASGEPLMILTGHDHEGRVEQTGNVLEIDGGTLGAGGVFEVGEQAAGFAQVHLDGSGWPAAVDLIAADPISGEATARRVAPTPDVDGAQAAAGDVPHPARRGGR